jgi:hypothetical protein
MVCVRKPARLMVVPKRNMVILGRIWLEHRDRGLLRGLH